MSTKKLMTPGNFEIRKKKKNENKTLLTPGDFVKLHIKVSDSGKKQEEYYIPKMIEPCKKCENVRQITGTSTVVRTGCYCSEIIPSNYLSITPSDDDIYKDMSVESDLPW